MSADSAPSSETNIFQSKLYTLIYCRHFRTYSRCAMFDWSGTVFRRRNVTRRPYYSIEEAKRTHPRFADCTSAVIRYLICVYASHFFAGRPYHFNQTLRTANKFKNGDNRWACFEKYWSLMKIRNQPTLRRMKIYYYWTNIRKWNYFNTSFIEDFRK